MAGYIIKVTLENTHPPVWRRIEIPEKISFFDLHCVIQAAFGWDGYHLHDFSFSQMDERIACGEYGTEPSEEEEGTAVDAFLTGERWIRYTYDFGDNWRHKIVLERIDEDYDSRTAVVLKVKGANFEEDSGGVWSEDEESCRYPVTAEEINQVLQGMVFEPLDASVENEEDEFTMFDDVMFCEQPQRRIHVLDEKIEQIREFWRQKEKQEKEETSLRQKKKKCGQKVVAVAFGEGQENRNYLVRGEAEVSCKTALKELGREYLLEFIKYLEIPYKKKGIRSEKLASLISGFLVENPVYLLYILDQEEYQSWLSFSQREPGIYKKGGPDLDDIMIWMLIGLVQIKLRQEDGENYMDICPVLETEQMAEALKKRHINNEYQKIHMISERVHACIRLYGVIEIEPFYQIYCELYGKEMEREEFERFLYLHENFAGNLQTFSTEEDKKYIATQELNFGRILYEREEFANEIGYFRPDREEIEAWQYGFMEANPFWESFWEFITEGSEDIEEQEELSCWIADLYTEVTSGISITELSVQAEEMLFLENLSDYVELWEISIGLCLTTNLVILKGYSRIDYGQLTGNNPIDVNGFCEPMLKKRITKKAHLYELPVNVQSEAYRFFLGQDKPQEKLDRECREFFEGVYRKNPELAFLYAYILVRREYYEEAETVIRELKERYPKEDEGIALLEEKIRKEKNRRQKVIYPQQWGGVPYRKEKKPQRNDPCPCGSGKKFKHCCGRNQ